MLRNNVFVDLGDLSCGCTDHVLGTIAKALSGEDGRGPDLWAHHDSPYISSLIELFTSRGLLQLDKVREELNAWIAGKRYVSHGTGINGLPVGTSGRLDANELALVRIYLENLPPAQFGPSEWGLLVDYLVSRYMPADTLRSEAEWLAVRATFMGKVQAYLPKLNAQQADSVVAALPTTVAKAKESFDPSTAIRHILDYGRARCADNIQGISDTTRHRIKTVILAHQEQVLLGDRPPSSSLQTQLNDEFGALNRDWRRIALTEVGDNAGNGLIASLKPGTRVRRLEQYRGACPFCQKINGKVFTVVAPDKRDKNWDTEVWPGKTNIGRSGAKKKRTDDGLVDRTPSELWTVTAGTIHPHCRGEWIVLDDARPDDDPKFAAWLEAHFAKHRKKPGSD